MQGPEVVPNNMLQVVNRLFQILQNRADVAWRRDADLIILLTSTSVAWDGFKSGLEMMKQARSDGSKHCRRSGSGSRFRYDGIHLETRAGRTTGS